MTTEETPGRTTRQQFLSALWDEHMQHEFATRDTEHTLATMTGHAHVNHVPTLTGGRGPDELREFYSRWFIPTHPPDISVVEVSRTIGEDRLAFEFVATFTHTTELTWMLPGVAPTGKRVEVAAVVIVQFDGDKLAHEHIYWDQASVLVQLGLLERAGLPIVGVESARKVLDPTLEPNHLITGYAAQDGARDRR